MTTAHSESSTERIPGRAWTVRLIGHADRSATVTCTTAACRMPARSKDLAALRIFAAQHVAAHAKAATLRPHASCHCRAQQCGAHPDTRVYCSGGVVLILRHDPTVGRVWTVEEVCEACAPLIPTARVLARAQRQPPAAPPAERVPAPARSSVPGGFSSVGAATADGDEAVRRPRQGPRNPRRRHPGQNR
ncbi:hypothetical protein [Streptomyces sp. NPDC055709]